MAYQTCDGKEEFSTDSAEESADHQSHNVYLRKKRPEHEVNKRILNDATQKLLLGPGRSRGKEWNTILTQNIDGTPAMGVHRGRELTEQFTHRIVPSRWCEKWNDTGDDFDNGLKGPNVPTHLGAKRRWVT